MEARLTTKTADSRKKRAEVYYQASTSRPEEASLVGQLKGSRSPLIYGSNPRPHAKPMLYDSLAARSRSFARTSPYQSLAEVQATAMKNADFMSDSSAMIA